MPAHFCLTVRFLDPEPRFHGRRDGGNPEWPPSPLRVFQALVATAYRRAPRGLPDDAKEALNWLERLPPPLVIAPMPVATVGYRISVPNNAMDIVAAAWARGNYSASGDADPRTHRAMKTIRPTLLRDGTRLHYVWSDSPIDERHARVLSDIAASLHCVGWGIDLVVGHGAVLSEEQVNGLSGERWIPDTVEAEHVDGLRVPTNGTLADLERRYDGFLRRLRPEGFVPPPPLSCFRAIPYRRATEGEARPMAVFSLLKPLSEVDSGRTAFRAFDPARRGLTVAGMLRHATKRVARRAGWEPAAIAQVVLGHEPTPEGNERPAMGGPRLAYVPIPTIEARGGEAFYVGAARRCMILAFGSATERLVAGIQRGLSGIDLIDENTNEPMALLAPLPSTDPVVRTYVDSASTWTTVTPVVLPGYDDPDQLRRKAHRAGISTEEQRRIYQKLAERTEGLIRKALLQAGFSDILARHVTVEWNPSGFLPGVELANRYGVPSHLRRFPRVHVKLRFRDPEGRRVRVPGPICIGGGRFYGLGLFTNLADKA